MQSAKRVTLVPPDQTGGSQEDNPDSGPISVNEVQTEKVDKIKFKISDKIHRFIKVILKLAKYQSYDDSLRIKSRSGNYLEQSNIVDLLTHAMAPGKVLHGEEEFIALLASCGVDPELILNENLKAKLIRFQSQGPSKSSANKEIIKNVISKAEMESNISDTPKPINKGNKKFIIVNEDGGEIESRPRQFKRKIIPSEHDDVNYKRKRADYDDDSIDDDMIDHTKWRM